MEYYKTPHHKKKVTTRCLHFTVSLVVIQTKSVYDKVKSHLSTLLSTHSHIDASVIKL